jgi:hypothetical protein
MQKPTIKLLLLTALLIAIASDALAARRPIRIEFFAWSDGFALGSSECPETTGNIGSVTYRGFEFSGDQGQTYLVDAYCQTPFPYVDGAGTDEYLNEQLLLDEGEPGLAAKVGVNEDNAVTARRYTFLDQPRFTEEPPFPTGFQWAFYFFPGDFTIVALYGLEGVTLNSEDHFIYDFSEDSLPWDGERDGFDGEYFCFQGNEFKGIWNGSNAGSSPLAGCTLPPKPEFIMQDGFEFCDGSEFPPGCPPPPED